MDTMIVIIIVFGLYKICEILFATKYFVYDNPLLDTLSELDDLYDDLSTEEDENEMECIKSKIRIREEILRESVKK